MSKLFNLIIFLIVTALFQACLPAKQFEDMKASRDKCTADLNELKSKQETLVARDKELTITIEDLTRRLKNLTTDTFSMGISYRRMVSNYDKLDKTYEQLLEKNKELLQGKDDDNKKLMGHYQLSQEELQKKEDKLRLAEAGLEKRKLEVDKLADEVKNSEIALAKKEQQVIELQSVLAKKDSTMKALRQKVSDALLSFQGNGLTVSMKNGKVYVSLEERLLFESGSTVVDSKGVDALRNIAKLLEKENDINVLVEGHTDNVPIKSATIKDNWDLSVLRATSIIRIIMANSKIDAKRLTAAGKGEFFPIDKANTPEARRKNRRTEIILSPKLDELFEILNDK
jgi:chemotaxis protein MotB